MNTQTHLKQTITVAVTGNPNSGKTTIFNCLTGANQKVGNYGGVTVETKEGILQHGQYTIRFVDLPGTYSLTAYSIEEIVARNFIIREQPDVVLNVVDGSNLERNLYLTAQLKELGAAMVVNLNMADEMKKKGVDVDLELLSQDLGAPVVPTVGTRSRGIRQLVEAVVEVATGKWDRPQSPPIHYGREIETELEKITHPIIERRDALQNSRTGLDNSLCMATSPHWVAIKLLENDKEVLQSLHDSRTRRAVSEQVERSRKRLTEMFGEDPETIIAEQRYGYVRGVSRAVIRQTPQSRMNLTDKLDKVLTNRALGLPIFAVLMYLTFWLVFTVGEAPMGWIESAFEHLADLIGQYWSDTYASPLRSLVIDGIIGGVGGVLVFVPNIVLLFAAIALLEDTGYMSRAAFIMDRLMKWVGLHGKSFIPMLTGFGCSVPAIMGTRILDNRRDRFTTLLVLPLMSCGARLPIYMLIIPAFFAPSRQATVMYSLYIIGIVVAVICAKLLRSTIFRGAPSPFVMELPPYRIPTLRAVLIHIWQRTWLYLRKAGTVILAFSIIMWALAVFPHIPAEQLEGLSGEQAQEAALRYSFTGRLGRLIAPVIKPMGFDWKIGTALVGAFPAKELFVAQMGIVYSLGEADEQSPALRDVLKKHYNPLIGFCVMLFCLLSTPCMATVAITRRETGSWLWALFQFGGLTLIAYVLTVIVYQTGILLKIGLG